jgi:hypothetical protein
MVKAVHTKLLFAWSSVVNGKALKTSFWNFPLRPVPFQPAGTISAGGTSWPL